MTKSALQTYLEKDDVKQVALARRLHVTRWTIRRWSKGTTPIPVDVLPRLSDATGIPISDLRPDLANVFGGRAA